MEGESLKMLRVRRQTTMPRTGSSLTYWNRWVSTNLLLRKARDAPEPASMKHRASARRSLSNESSPASRVAPHFLFPEIRDQHSFIPTITIQPEWHRLRHRSCLSFRSGRAGGFHSERMAIEISEYVAVIGGGGSGGRQRAAWKVSSK